MASRLVVRLRNNISNQENVSVLEGNGRPVYLMLPIVKRTKVRALAHSL